VIVEYAAAAGGRLIALASTHSSAPAVARGVPFAFVEASARPHPEWLEGPTADRVTLQIDDGLRREIRESGPATRRGIAKMCAENAVTEAREFTDGMDESQIARNILDQPELLDPRRISVLDPKWQRLEMEHADLSAREHAARLDVRDIPVSKLDTAGGDGTRSFFARLYAMEAVLALRNQSADEALASAVYSWQMITKIPQLGPNAAARAANAPLLVPTP
jgi:hypothetical protein